MAPGTVYGIKTTETSRVFRYQTVPCSKEIFHPTRFNQKTVPVNTQHLVGQKIYYMHDTLR